MQFFGSFSFIKQGSNRYEYVLMKSRLGKLMFPVSSFFLNTVEKHVLSNHKNVFIFTEREISLCFVIHTELPKHEVSSFLFKIKVKFEQFGHYWCTSL